MKKHSDLDGKVVLLTGGRGFLGAYFTEALKGAGAKVIVTDVVEGADEIMDVTDQGSVDAVFAKVAKEHGQIDVVINNAAIDPKFDESASKNEKQFVNYPEEAMQKSIDVNLLGTWRVCKAAIKQMQEQGYGNVVNVASFYGITPPRQEIYPQDTEKPVDYPITKAAIVMLTRHIASQFGRVGIRCNALAPGGVLNKHDEEFQKKYAAHTSLGRMSEPEEVADTLVFLASDASRGMTGEVVAVDGGWRSR